MKEIQEVAALRSTNVMEQLVTAICLLALASQVSFDTLVLSVDCKPVESGGAAGGAEAEVEALLQFKVGYIEQGRSQHLLRSWDERNTSWASVCASWVGVSCTRRHIVSLNLAGLGLEGSLAPHLGNLTFLSTLNLSHNSFTGSMPPNFVVGCHSLRILDMSSNNLTGLIPSSLTSLPSLQFLDLCTNNLSGHIPSALFTNASASLVTVRLCRNVLSGSILPHDLGFRLPFLRELDMSQNVLTGRLPTSLSNCSNLAHLSLAFNHLTGSIPPQLGMLQNLQVLYLPVNNFTGEIPPGLGNCTKLLSLYLASNIQLTGAIPAELGNLRYLQKLVLQDCIGLTGTIPSSLTNCSHLLLLELGFNQLEGAIPSKLGLHLANLEILILAHNNLTGSIPTSLGNCTRLKHLELTHNQLSGVIPTELGFLGSLEILVLALNLLKGGIPSSLGNCTSLEQLYLSQNQLSGAIPLQLARLGPTIQVLDLHENELSGTLQEGLDFSNFSQLTALNVAANTLRGSLLPSKFAALQQVQLLDLANNEFMGAIPWDSIANCSLLYILDLSYNYLSGGISSSLARLRALKFLYLIDNKLEGELPDSQDFEHLSLQLLNLAFNNLSGSLPSSLAPALSTLTDVLFLAGNRFSGPLPPWLGLLGEVTNIDLSDNHFTGSIPPSLGGCFELVGLFLNKNHLSGEVPDELGNLTSLEALDLSSNNFSGVLPSFLSTTMPSLQLLNVSFNNFTGAIPTHGIFTQLNASSFQGNPRLCGPILNKPCDGNVPSVGIGGQKRHHQRRRSWRLIILLITVASLATLAGVVVILFTAHRCYGRSKPVDMMPASSLAGTKRFTEKELMEATQGYSEANVLGAGGLAVVYKGILSDGSTVAVKKFRDTICKGTSHKALQQEMHILGKLRHRNLVRILGCVLNLDVKVLVLEHMANGSLEHYLNACRSSQRGLTNIGLQQNETHSSVSYWEMVSKVALGIGHALAYLHREYGESIIHGDVKPSNILLDADMEPHLADFGLARLIKRGAETASLSSDFQGSIGYMAPEYGYATQISTGVDVYSYGVVLIRMLTGRSPVEVEPPCKSIHDWVKSKLAINAAEGESEEAVLDPALVQKSNFAGRGASSSSDNQRSTIIAAQAMQLLRTSLACTADNPDNRPSIQEVLTYIS